MDIKYLPTIPSPNPNDWLFIQRGASTFKIKYSTINPDIISNDEDDMYLGTTPPTNPTTGKLWGEIDSSGKLLETWYFSENQYYSLIKNIPFFGNNFSSILIDLRNFSFASAITFKKISLGILFQDIASDVNLIIKYKDNQGNDISSEKNFAITDNQAYIYKYQELLLEDYLDYSDYFSSLRIDSVESSLPVNQFSGNITYQLSKIL